MFYWHTLKFQEFFIKCSVIYHINDLPVAILGEDNLIVVCHSHNPCRHVYCISGYVIISIEIFIKNHFSFSYAYGDFEERVAITPTLFAEFITRVFIVELLDAF